MADYSSDSSYSDSSEEDQLQKKPKLVRAKKTPEPAPPPEEPEVKPKRKYVKKEKTPEEAAAIKAKRIEILAKAREAKKASQTKKKQDLDELKEIKQKPVKEKKPKKDKKEATIVNNYYYTNDTPTNSPTAAPSDKKNKPVKQVKEKKTRPTPVDTPKKLLFV
tara:strand:- start:59 stop:547 length:489 start_codon:yes stop_codon:yes gene_type:complete